MFKDSLHKWLPSRVRPALHNLNGDNSVHSAPRNRLVQNILNVVIIAVTVSYPFLVWYFLDYFQPRTAALALAALFLLRSLLRNKSAARAELPAVLIGVLFLLATALVNETDWLLVYPMFISLTFFAVFFFSLFFPPTVVERLARFEDPDLPPKGVSYTRKVTQVWCGFFLVNAALSLFTVWYGDRWLWSLYNGCIFYILMGFLMAAEMTVRRKVKASY